MTSITPAAAAARICAVPGVGPAAVNALKALMPLIEQWDTPAAMPNETAEKALGVSRRMVTRHLSTLAEVGLITLSSAGRARLVTLNLGAIQPYIQAEKAPGEYGTLAMANNGSSHKVPHQIPPQVPHQVPHQNRPHFEGDVNGNNGMDMPRKSTCFLDIKENKENKENIRIYMPSHFLFSFSGLQCDLNPLVEAAGLKRLTPFGQPHSWIFDFTQAYELLAPCSEQLQLAAQDQDWSGYHFHNPKFDKFKHDFFLMSVVIELGCCMDDCFTLPSKLDRSGSNISEFWYEQQQGAVFACINECYPEGDCGAVMRQVKSTWKPSRGKSMYEYAQIVLKNELIDLLNMPETAQQCYRGFMRAFRLWACSQGYLNNAVTRLRSDKQWLAGIWGPDLKTGLCSRETRGYKPRLTAPMLLMRHLIGMNQAANLWQYQDEEPFFTAAAVLMQAFKWEPYASQFRTLAASLSDQAPWMTRFYQSDVWSIENE